MAEVRLSQLLATEKQIKTRALEVSKKYWHSRKNLTPWTGVHKWFVMKNETDLQIPEEQTDVELVGERAVRDVIAAYGAELDAACTRDEGNTLARGTVYMDGEIVAGLEDEPAVTLLAMERKLDMFAEFVRNLPTLDANEEWTPSGNAGVWMTANPHGQQRNRRVTAPLLLAEATEHHKAQVTTVESDIPIANAYTRKYSGALPADEQGRIADEAERLSRAVKFAREEANTQKVSRRKVSDAIVRVLGV